MFLESDAEGGITVETALLFVLGTVPSTRILRKQSFKICKNVSEFTKNAWIPPK